MQAVKHEYESLLRVMNMFQESDAVACGFLKKLQQMKFFGTIYILAEILPILLSKVFQAGKFKFSSIAPAIAKAEAELEDLKSKGTAIEKLQKDVESLEYISVRIKITPSSLEELVKIQEKYIDILVENINKRFESIKQIGVPSALAIFDPIAVPDTNDSSFKEYGQDQIKVLAAHFFTEISCEKLLSEWSQMKYHINENIMKAVPKKIRKGKSKITPTGGFLTEIMRQKVTYEPCFGMLLNLAEIAFTIPVTNAWPERGASAMKLVKTRCRSSLQNDTLEALLMVLINGPPVKQCKPVIQNAVRWIDEKKRKKLPRIHAVNVRNSPNIGEIVIESKEQSTQTELFADEEENMEALVDLINCDEESVNEEVQAVGEMLHLPDMKDNIDSDYDSDYSSDCSLF